MSSRKRYPEVEADFELHETIGSGGFAKVKAAVHKLTGEKVAVKIMDKVHLGDDLPRVYREMRAMKRLHHQHICQLYQIIETERMIYMVLEYCPGGEVFDYIVAKERLREREARSFFRQILAALRYVHEMGFIHRDLKPENLLLDDDSNIKLIDFGLVAEPDSTDDWLKTCCGSPAYAAPELIQGGPYIGTRADVWSLGVLLYALLNGFLPFDDDHTAYLYRLIQKGEYEIPEWLSPGSVRMIAKLLQTDPDQRITVEELLGDNWVMKGYNKPVDWESMIDLDDLDNECIAEMASYYQLPVEEMSRRVHMWNYDSVTVTYFLLLQQKNRGFKPAIKLSSKKQVSNTSVATSSSSGSSITSPLATAPNVAVQNGHALPNEVEHTSSMDRTKPGEQSNASILTEITISDDEVFKQATPPPPDKKKPPSKPILVVQPDSQSSLQPPEDYMQNRRLSLGQPMHPPEGEILTLKKPLPVPIIDFLKNEETVSVDTTPPKAFLSPPPTRKMLSVDASNLPTSSTMTFGDQPEYFKVTKTRSYDTHLHNAVDRSYLTAGLTPTHHPRKRFGSLDRVFKKVKRAFSKRSTDIGPRRVKALFSCSTTSMQSADAVLQEIERVLQNLEVAYIRKNYVLRCKIQGYSNPDNGKRKVTEFSLEVCLLPTVDMIGVRRKRMRGDVWEYKRYCDLIFKATVL